MRKNSIKASTQGSTFFGTKAHPRRGSTFFGRPVNYSKGATIQGCKMSNSFLIVII
ncbi:hypothetical protein RND71_023144 [Anisodus tanguticus]|uniref:Uncharacterized protein n=1 Tax=Anisodus tanguticus TaxID=243964 RepID=A0AAE1VDJ1_9SOLA|nr:hypothetical protein RND71_023144 [Anisodus tanguticus]